MTLAAITALYLNILSVTQIYRINLWENYSIYSTPIIENLPYPDFYRRPYSLEGKDYRLMLIANKLIEMSEILHAAHNDNEG